MLPYFVPIGGFMLTPRYDDDPDALGAAVKDMAQCALETCREMGWAKDALLPLAAPAAPPAPPTPSLPHGDGDDAPPAAWLASRLAQSDVSKEWLVAGCSHFGVEDVGNKKDLAALIAAKLCPEAGDEGDGA